MWWQYIWRPNTVHLECSHCFIDDPDMEAQVNEWFKEHIPGARMTMTVRFLDTWGVVTRYTLKGQRLQKRQAELESLSESATSVRRALLQYRLRLVEWRIKRMPHLSVFIFARLEKAICDNKDIQTRKHRQSSFYIAKGDERFELLEAAKNMPAMKVEILVPNKQKT